MTVRKLIEKTDTRTPVTMRVCEDEMRTLRKWIESKFPVGEPTDYALSVTGEPYTEYSETGAETARDARLVAMATFERISAGKTGAIYWRVVPEIEYFPGSRKFSYYMRLLISAKEPLRP